MLMHITKAKLAEIINRQTPEMRMLMREKTHLPECSLNDFLRQPEANHLSADQLENIAAYHFGQHMNASYDDEQGHVALTPKRQESGTFGARAPVAKGAGQRLLDATKTVNVPAGLSLARNPKRGSELPSPSEAKIAARKEQEAKEATQARNPIKRVTQAIPLWGPNQGAKT